MAKEGSAEATIREIKRKTRRKYSAEEKIRIVVEGLRGEGRTRDMRPAIRKIAQRPHPNHLCGVGRRDRLQAGNRRRCT